MNKKDWTEELKKIFASEIDENPSMIGYFLELYPSKEFWDEFSNIAEQDDAAYGVLGAIRSHFFDEDECEKFIFRCIAGEDEAVKKGLSILRSYSKAGFRSFKRDAKTNKYHSLRSLDRYTPYTSEEKKTYRKFRQLTREKGFNNDVQLIRDEYELNFGDVSFNEGDYKEFNEYDIGGLIWNETTDLLIKYGLSTSLRRGLAVYIVFTEVPVHLNSPHAGSCELTDRNDSLEHQRLIRSNKLYMSEDSEEDASHKRFAKKLQVNNLREYPISIRITPHATISDIKKFVELSSERLKELQQVYLQERVDTKTFKVRITNKKYDYIWENQDNDTRPVLAEKVNQKFRTRHDAIYVRNIISRENKRRGKP
ncbi:MAG: hypothetical protein ACI9H6_000116 [Patiriisocius sp.]|jgi:hypothetical protein